MKNLILLLLVTLVSNVAKSEEGETEAMNFYGNTTEEACRVAQQKILNNPNIILKECHEVPLRESNSGGKKVLAVYKCSAKTDGNFFDCGISHELLEQRQKQAEELLRQQQLQREKQAELARNQKLRHDEFIKRKNLIKMYNNEQAQYKKQRWLQEQYGPVFSLVKEANYCEIGLMYDSRDVEYSVEVECSGDSSQPLRTGVVYKIGSSDVSYNDKKLLFMYIRSRMIATGFTLVAECRSGHYDTEVCDLQRTGNK